MKISMLCASLLLSTCLNAQTSHLLTQTASIADGGNANNIAIGTDSTVFLANHLDGLRSYTYNRTSFTNTAHINSMNVEKVAVGLDNTVFFMSTDSLYAYRYNDGAFTHIAEIEGPVSYGSFTLGANGTVFSAGHYLKAFNYDGSSFNEVAASGYHNGTAFDIALGDDGTIFLIAEDMGGSDLWAYTYDGTSFTSIAHIVVGSGGRTLCVGPDGTIFVPNSGVRAYNYDGSSFNEVAAVYAPGFGYGITTAADGTVFLANYYGLRAYSYDGSSFTNTAIASVSGGEAMGVTVGADGTVYLANGSGGMIAFVYRSGTQIINVPTDQLTIQAGIDAALDGDTVLVQPGTYYENIIWPATNGITLLSAGDTSNTIIDGGGNNSVITINGAGLSIDSTTIIRGFTLTNGISPFYGGGLAIDSVQNPVFDKLIITNSSAWYGGGISCKKGEPQFSNLAVRNNTSTEGGGFYFYDNSNAILTGIEIGYNNASKGGGLFCNEHSSPIVTNSTFHHNTATVGGGGVSVYQYSHIEIHNSTFDSNICESSHYGYGHGGGGLHSDRSNPIIDSTLFIRNYSAGYGGGMKAFPISSPQISNSVFLLNRSEIGGGGLEVDNGGSPIVANTKFISNVSSYGGGLSIGAVGEGTYSGNLFAYNSANYGGGASISDCPAVFIQNTIINNSAVNDGDGVYAFADATPSISSNNIISNGVGLFNASQSTLLHAPNNYWGSSSGSYHDVYNISGEGDTTAHFANPTPFLTSPNIVAPPIPIQNVKVTDSGNDFVSIQWEASLLADLASYKLYYGTDTSRYSYTNSINLATMDTSFTINGLALSTTYYFAVTCIDTADNESWYSKRATGVTRLIQVQNLDIAGDEDLQHLVTHDPLITFDYFDSMGEAQTAYQIQISTDSTFQSADIWDTGVVTSDETSVQYVAGALLNGVKYYLRAKVASGDFWSEWATLTFRMNTEPSAPEILFPGNGEVVTTQPTLKFLKSNDAEEDVLMYSVFLYSTEEMVSPLDSLVNYTGMTDTITWAVSVALDDNAQHWWKVKANDGYEYSSLTEVGTFLFNINNDAPSEFSLISPVGNVEVTSLNPLLTWHLSDDLDPLDTVNYVLYLDTPDPGVETFTVGTDTSYQVVTSLLDNTTYSWKVIASDMNGASTENTDGYQAFRVNTTNDLPTAFNLLAPEDGAMVVDLTPTLMWEPSSDPDDGVLANREVRPIHNGSVRSTNSTREITAYQVYLDTDSLFTETIPVEVFDVEYSPETDLTENQVYYWTVSAVDDSGGVTFSDTASFWTNAENEAPAEFSLLLPAVDEVLNVLSPTFTWEPSDDPDLHDGFGYQILLGSSPEEMDTLWSGEDTTFTLDWELDDNQTYYWSVYAEDWSGLVTFNTGGYHSFTVNTSNDLPLAFELLYPVYDEMVTNLQLEFLWEASSDPDDGTIALRESGKGNFTAITSTGNNSVAVITGYAFYLSTDSMLTDAVAVEVMGTSYLPDTDLTENQVYYWAVSAVDDSGGVTFSDTASFWTNEENEAPAEFSLLLPAVDEVLNVLSPTFTWEPSSNPDLQDGFDYNLVLGADPGSMDTLWSGSDTSLTLDWELDDNTTYYWSVFAEDWSGLVTFNTGGYQSFTVNQGNDDPSIVDLITPDSVMVLTLTPEMYWTPAFDADPGDIVSYEMHWWGDGIEYDSVLTDTHAVILPRALEDNSLYFWDVIAMDQNGGISHSDEAFFWTNLAPEAPVGFALVSPENDVAGLSDMPVFIWEYAEDPDPMDYATYTLLIATDSSFSEITFQTNTNADVGHEMTEALAVDTEYWWRVIAADTDSLTTESETFKFTVGYVAIADAVELPTEYVLDQNFPNPFNPSTTLRYGLPEDATVSLVIYDIRGNVVKTIDSGAQVAGWYEHVWNGMDESGQPVSTGLYLARLQAGSYSKVIKLLFLK